jgi:multidrug efflux pump
VKKVYLQGSAESRMTPEDLNKWFVRNADGQMVPFSAFATGQWIYASPRLERYNGLPSTEISAPAPGQSSGVAMKEIEKLAEQLPPGIGYEWTGLSTEERDSGSQTTQLYAISILIVFLCLAALYESWSVPFSVLLVVPLGWSARCWRPLCSSCPTTCTSRSAC